MCGRTPKLGINRCCWGTHCLPIPGEPVSACTSWGRVKRSARAVQLFGRVAVVETHTLWYFGHHCSLIVGFDALGMWHFWMFTLFHPFLLFCRRLQAMVVGTAEDGLLHLEYYQDGLRVVNWQCKMESISFAIPTSDLPLDCLRSPPPNTQSSSPPKALGPSPLPQEPGRSPSRSPLLQFESPNCKGVSKGRA